MPSTPGNQTHSQEDDEYNDDNNLPAMPNSYPSQHAPSNIPTVAAASNVVARPERPLNAYNIFFQQERLRILESLPDQSPNQKRPSKSHGKCDFATMARTVASRWKNLSESQRSHYHQLADQAKQKYYRDMNAWYSFVNKDDEEPKSSSSQVRQPHELSTAPSTTASSSTNLPSNFDELVNQRMNQILDAASTTVAPSPAEYTVSAACNNRLRDCQSIPSSSSPNIGFLSSSFQPVANRNDDSNNKSLDDMIVREESKVSDVPSKRLLQGQQSLFEVGRALATPTTNEDPNSTLPQPAMLQLQEPNRQSFVESQHHHYDQQPQPQQPKQRSDNAERSVTMETLASNLGSEAVEFLVDAFGVVQGRHHGATEEQEPPP